MQGRILKKLTKIGENLCYNTTTQFDISLFILVCVVYIQKDIDPEICGTSLFNRNYDYDKIDLGYSAECSATYKCTSDARRFSIPSRYHLSEDNMSEV